MTTIPTNHYGIDGQVYPSLEVAQEAVRTLLRFIGQDPTLEEFLDTPRRVCTALSEMTKGYRDSPKSILSRVFSEQFDELIVLKGITFSSTCSHHLLPFTGTADVGYLPGKRGVVGLSKLARLVDCFAKRLQVQERLTRQIATSIQEHLDALGVAVVLKAAHSCMSCRGVLKQGSSMVTSCMLGVFRTKPEARAEFFALTS